MTMKMRMMGLTLTTAAIAFAAASANASVISYNFDNNGTVGGDGAGSGPVVGEYAGVVSVDHWYNSWPDNPSTDLVDDGGNVTTMDIGWWSSHGTWSVGGHPGADDAPTDSIWNMEMLNGYLNSGTGPVVGLDLKEIPFSMYDVYVYFNADVAGREGQVAGKESDTDGGPWGPATTYYFSTNATITSFEQTTDTTDDAADMPANYAVFSGTSDYFNIETTILDFGGIAGVQIVEVPEPTSLALLGGLLLIGIRRR